MTITKPKPKTTRKGKTVSHKDHKKQALRIFQEFLHARGMRLTQERRILLDSVVAIEGHFSITDLYEHIQRTSRGAGAHRATFYRMFPLLEECGIVRKIYTGNVNDIKYEHTIGHEHHDHFVCVRCGKTRPFHSREIETLKDKLCRANGFEELIHTFCIRGLCRKCRRR